MWVVEERRTELEQNWKLKVFGGTSKAGIFVSVPFLRDMRTNSNQLEYFGVSPLAPHEPRTTGRGYYLIQPTRKGQQVSLCFGFDNRRCNCICSNNNRTSLSVNLHQELKGAEVHFAQRI